MVMLMAEVVVVVVGDAAETFRVFQRTEKEQFKQQWRARTHARVQAIKWSRAIDLDEKNNDATTTVLATNDCNDCERLRWWVTPLFGGGGVHRFR